MSGGSGRTPLILDVDTGIDDALALAFAVRSPSAEVVAVTTLAGNVGVEKTTANTLAALDLLGADAIPVHRGASRPLVRPHVDAAYFHDTTGLGDARLPTSGRGVGPDRGPAAIVRLASARPGELTLVCLGPLTNLAIAVNVAPELPDLLRGLVVMGGAFDVPGNITPVAEFNIYADPEAAAQVLALPWPRATVVGLDVTHRVAFARAAWEAAERSGSGNAAALLVAEVARAPFRRRNLPSIFLHDPLAVAVALAPDLIETEGAAIAVATDGEERGRTRVVGPGPLRIARAVDSERFLDRFASTLGLRASRA